MHFLVWKLFYFALFCKFNWNTFPRFQFCIKPAQVQIMALQWTAKWLSEPLVAQSTEAYSVTQPQWVNTTGYAHIYGGDIHFLPQVKSSPPRQNGCHFTDDIFKCIFWNENVSISLKISLKFVPKVPINNIPALVQGMAWRLFSTKPLPEPMMTDITDESIRHKWKMSQGHPEHCLGQSFNPHETARYGEIASAILNFFVCCMEMG